MKDIELNIIKISINILKLQKTIRHNLTIKHYYFKSLVCVCCLGEPTLFTHIILKSDWCPSLRSRVTDSEDVHCLLPLCLSPQLKSWGQEAAMRYGRRAWNAWPRVAPGGPMPDPRPQCYSSVSTSACYWMNPERSGGAEVSTQRFRHPETRTHLCLSVPRGLRFHTQTRLCSRSLIPP